MLQIKKQHSVIKGMTAGAVAFAIGLTGAAALIGNEFQSDPQVFNREQRRSTSSQESSNTDPKTTDQASQNSGSDAQGASTSGDTQPASSPLAPTASGSTNTSSTPTSSSVPATTAPSDGDSGGGTSDSGGCLCEDIQDAAGTILNQSTGPIETTTGTKLP